MPANSPASNLRAEVGRRTCEAAEAAQTVPADPTSPPRYTIRPKASLEELAAAFNVIGAQFVPAITHEDQRYQDLARRFPEDHSLMLLLEEEDTKNGTGRIVGGALALGGPGITLRAIGLEAHVRRRGLGRQLMERIEWAAIRRGASGISLGATDESKGFYARLGYAGRGMMMHKGLPLPGRFLDARLRKLANTARTKGQGETPQ